MKAVLISIKPKWCKLIADGKKTMEVRKTKPKLQVPFKCYIYCTQNELLTKSHHNGMLYVASNKKYKTSLEMNGNLSFSGKVIGEFFCDNILGHCEMANADIAEQQACVKREKIFEYANGKEIYGWHISELKIYNHAKELDEFFRPCDKPQFYDCSKCTDLNEYSCKALERPPQSWCYVEAVRNNRD